MSAAKKVSLAELMALACPVHGKSCGTIVDHTRVYVNGAPSGHIEVFCAYKLNAAFDVRASGTPEGGRR